MRKIKGHVRYVGPTVAGLGLHYGNTFTNGIWPHWYPFIKECPALGELFVPVEDWAVVRRELDFDYARNMRGTKGKYVAFYQQVQNWLADRAKKQPPSQEGVKVTHHA